MNAKLIELAERRTALIARATTQRAELSLALAPWRETLAAVSLGWAVIGYMRSHVALLLGVAALVATFRPLRLAKWLERGWLLWSMARVVKRFLRG